MSLVLVPYVGGSIFPCMYVDGASVTIKLFHTGRLSFKRYLVPVCRRRGHRLYVPICIVDFRPILSLYECAPGACEFTYTPVLSSAPIDTQGVRAVTQKAASHARMRAHTLTRKEGKYEVRDQARMCAVRAQIFRSTAHARNAVVGLRSRGNLPALLGAVLCPKRMLSLV